jgi:uncharacterized protein (TIGR03437 family)
VPNVSRLVHARILTALVFFSVAGAICAQIPGGSSSWDSSGNTLLTGTYNFRQVYYQLGDTNGNLSTGYALYGTVAFDGRGKYTLTSGTLITRTAAGVTATPVPAQLGYYTIAASGYGYLSEIYCPLDKCAASTIYVLVAQSMIVGSAPENNLNELFIAAPAAQAATAASAFHGSWTMAAMIPAVGPSAGNSADAFFQMSPDGKGAVSSVSVTGYVGNDAGKQTTQTASAVTFTGGDAGISLSLPTNTFFSGQAALYFSPDGTFCFGGSLNAPDMIVGVQNPAGTPPALGGMYFIAGIDQNAYNAAQGFVNLDTYNGVFNAAGTKIIEADRMLAPVNGGTLSTNSSYPRGPAASSSVYNGAGLTQSVTNSPGTVRIASGLWPTLGLSVALKAPALTGSGVFLNPTGVTNAASFAPFTAGISPGEYIVLYGSNLSPAGTTVASSLPLPTTLAGVQVNINGIQAPIYYVTPTQISVIVPSAVTGPVAQIQVINNGVQSNTVTQYVYKTSPGLFTNPSDGVSLGAIEHADGTLVTEASPAVPGETVEVFMTGLGPVNPTVSDGAAAGVPLSTVTSTLIAYISGAKASISFAGLVPTLAALYQVNVVIPTNAAAGDQIFELDAPGSVSAQGIIPIRSN